MSRFESVYAHLPEGWLSEEEALLLYYCARMTVGPILEVGTYKGRSAVLLASLKRPVYCVDPFDGFDSDLTGDQVHGILVENLRSRFITNVTVFRCKLAHWTILPVGFAYLDGDHTLSGTVEQINIARKAGARSVCIHDYAEGGGGASVKAAVEEAKLVITHRVGRMVHYYVPAQG